MAGYNSVSTREKDGDKMRMRVPLASHFWCDPPKEDTADTVSRGQRRSSRLVAKRLDYSEKNLKIIIPNDQFSDYGTGSERSFYQNSQDVEGRCFSPYDTLSEDEEDLLSDVVQDHTLSPGYRQPDDLDKHLSDLSLQEEDLLEENDITFLNISNLSARGLKICKVYLNGISMLVPLQGYTLPKSKIRSPSHSKNPFSIAVTTLNLEPILLQKGLRISQACPIFKFEPIGTSFCELYPTIAVIHLSIIPFDQDEVICLCSNNPETDWQILPQSFLSKDRTKMSVNIHFFSYVTVVIRQKCPQKCKYIRCRAGGRLQIPDFNVTVEFPKGSTSEDIQVSAKVCFDKEFSSRNFFSAINDKTVSEYSETLASPTICLEPHGLYFEQPVKITIPIPDYEEIASNGIARLRILHSNAKNETDEPNWQYLDTPFFPSRVKGKNGTVTVITFSVHHFSFFRAVWDKISNSVFQARNSMFYFLISYAMKVQAFCEEFEDDKFGLEVICFRDDKKFPVNQTYKFQVGQSQSKLIKPGRLLVRLKSLHFIADVEAGEDENLVKEEDFGGWDFEKQFACKFKPDQKKVERGTFGKVTVTRKNRNQELLFEFNIQKYGHENENTPNMPDCWGQTAIAELAANFFITDGDNWKKLATHIGFTKTEIKTNFKNTLDPIGAIITKYKQRGGTADEFVRAIYSVHRSLKNDMSSPSSSQQSRSSNNSSGRGSMPKNNKHNRYGHESDTSGTQTSLYSQDSLLSSTRKRSNPSVQESTTHDFASKPKRRRVQLQNSEKMESLSDADGESSSGSDSEKSRLKKEADSNSIQFRRDMTKLNNSFLWEISADMDTITWRALGRSLGVEESTLINIEHAHKSSGFREMSYQVLLHWKEKFPRRCTFGTLYGALSKENMNSAAKKMIEIKKNDSDS